MYLINQSRTMSLSTDNIKQITIIPTQGADKNSPCNIVAVTAGGVEIIGTYKSLDVATTALDYITFAINSNSKTLRMPTGAEVEKFHKYFSSNLDNATSIAISLVKPSAKKDGQKSGLQFDEAFKNMFEEALKDLMDGRDKK